MNYLHHLKGFKLLKIALFLFLITLSSSALFAQVRPATTPPTPAPPLPTREISGIIKDSTDLAVIGATVSLTSDKDTLKTSTNTDGVFVFKNVKSATYTIVVKSIGFVNSPVMRFKQNDMIPRIIMDPIVLKEESNTLIGVTIEGTPSITYKTDTVEYKASDYVVRANSTVDELLKKMEGMEVGNDGTLVHQGQSVTRAKVNGKEYQGGDIATAIKNLPAEIVDKIQIVDDYGDQAARTGIKDGDPTKVLNITTRTDKSVGNMLNLNAGVGSNERVESGAFATRINGNQTIGANGRYNNTVNGVAGSDNGGGGGNGGGGSGSGGTTSSGNGSFSYRDRLGKKIEVNLNYGYTGTGVNSINSTESLTNSTIGSTFSIRDSESDNLSKNHNFKLELESELDSNNFLRVIPTIRYTSSDVSSFSSLKQTGLLNQLRVGNNTNVNTRPELGISVFYQHIFEKPRRNFSLQADVNSNDQKAEQEQDTKILYYADGTETIVKDSLINRIIARNNLRDNYRGSLTYVEPLSTNTQMELNAQINYNGYDNTATTRNIVNGGPSSVIDSLSNIYNYSFTQARIALNFRYGLSNTSKFRFSAGMTAVPAVLSGTKASLGTSTDRKSFNLIPIARFDYLWSRQHRFSINYSGNAVEPTFDQIQPVRDVTNPQNPIIGNPDLKATFAHTIRADYNNYIANSKLNYTVNITSSVTENAVIRNNVEVRDFSVPNDTVYITETRYLNMNGVYRVGGNYSISKQINNRKYNLSFSGSATFDHRISMSNNEKNLNTVQTFIERFGPRINPTEWFEINPNVSYNYTKSTNTIERFIDNETNTLALNLDGRMYFWNTYLFGYSASKNYVRGISSNVNNNPLVVNVYFEKELFNRRGKVTVQAFDLFNQNNFVNRNNSDDGGYTDTKSNALSRYFMVRLSMRLQKWTGAQGRNGRDIRRRGDGSFM
ncbi:TonB-dependent receptor [Pedobacter metabolipauper]|uniref:Carboxypeptidase-like protein n=1 Tax=Pedobacter metabolipauper TaxID=425513 RepID=A0A4R6SRL1_9SPHI|nr:TonB-dependent receptor [Pedobacter metabolipauper]TDQ06997.1 carboxypeptidase-like protein [Pedobacter metabolipauper]